MAILGCHSCSVDLSKYKDVPYQQTPCAQCKLARDSQKTFKRISLFDSDASVDDLADTAQAQQQQDGFAIPPWIPLRIIEQIKKACQANMLVTLSNIILKMIRLSKESPTTVQVVMLKMQHPQMSYYQIASALNPPCSKQNVLHHLKHAVSLFPQLAKALLVDTRFSSGRGSAVHSIARMRQNSAALQRLKNAMYRSEDHNTVMSVDSINQIFKMPYNSRAVALSEYSEDSND